MFLIDWLFLIVTLLFALMALVWSFSNILSFLYGAPPINTPEVDICDAIACAKPKKGETIIDLGCGDGRVLLAAAKQFGLKGIGYELSPWNNFVSKMKVLVHNLTNEIKIHQKNFYFCDISEADIIYLYLLPETLKSLTKKFILQLKPNARIISYAFPIPGWKANTVKSSKRNKSIKYYTYSIKNVLNTLE